MPHPAPLLPQLDLSRLDGRATDHLDFLADLRVAAHDLGFFYLTGHGITAKQCEEILAVARKFFDLPEAAKLEVEMIHSPHFRGYTRTGRELTRGRPDWREQFDINRTQPSISYSTTFWFAAVSQEVVHIMQATSSMARQSTERTD